MRSLASSVVVLLFAARASAQDISLRAEEDACPSRAAVREELAKVAPQARIVTHDAALDVTVSDLGDAYLVDARREKIYDDRVHRCDERARSIALVIALAIDAIPHAPPTIAAQAPPLSPIVQASPRRRVAFKEEMIAASGYSDSTRRSFGGADVLAIDVALGRVQLGAWFAVPFAQDAGDIAAVPHAIVSLPHDTTMRFELGFSRAPYYYDERSASCPTCSVYRGNANSLFAAFSLATRERVHRRVAITFGDASARDEWPTQIGHSGTTLTSSSLSTFAIAADRTGHDLSVSLAAPIGIRVQAHDELVLLAACGPHVLFDAQGYVSGTLSFPLLVEGVVTPTERFDLGASVLLQLYTESPLALVSGSLFARARF